MEENNDSSLADEFLHSLSGMRPAEPNPFFYTRLKGRLQHKFEKRSFFPLPVWVTGMLFLLLTINTWMIIQIGNANQQTAEKKSPAQVFAETYNLSSDSNY